MPQYQWSGRLVSFSAHTPVSERSASAAANRLLSTRYRYNGCVPGVAHETSTMTFAARPTGTWVSAAFCVYIQGCSLTECCDEEPHPQALGLAQSQRLSHVQVAHRGYCVARKESDVRVLDRTCLSTIEMNVFNNSTCPLWVLGGLHSRRRARRERPAFLSPRPGLPVISPL
jgi:hypothetical protein